MNPILRWAGSKRKLLGELRALTPSRLERYIEPFAGSAALFFDLLPGRSVLGDLNPEVIATYAAIRDTPGEVSRHLHHIPKTRDAYYALRSLDPSQLNNVERAARLIYLMKACFNGVYRTNQQGFFNVPMGNKFFALPAPEVINIASQTLQDVDLICGDFAQTTARAGEGDFVYLDPPYSDGNRFRGEYSYQGAFQSDDQIRLVNNCQELSNRGVSVLLSFKESAAVCEALRGWSLKRMDVSRSVAGFAHSRRHAREILAYNYQTSKLCLN
jgi:DNA adenine methylase